MHTTGSARVTFACFNSTLVRLKCKEGDNEGGLTMFQLHYGSIKILKKSEFDKFYTRFNSTMVRLK